MQIEKMFALTLVDPEGDESTILANVNGQLMLMVTDATHVEALVQMGPQLAASLQTEISMVSFDRLQVETTFHPPIAPPEEEESDPGDANEDAPMGDQFSYPTELGLHETNPNAD